MSASLSDKILDKFSNSRYASISLVLHVILIAVFGTTVLFEAVSEPPDFEGAGGEFVSADSEQTAAPPPTSQMNKPQQPTEMTVQTPVAAPSNPLTAITTTATSEMNFSMDPSMLAPKINTAAVSQQATQPQVSGAQVSADSLSAQQAAQIRNFTSGWGKGKSGSGTGTREREFEFIAYVGQYSGGNWDSTFYKVRKSNQRRGALPNFLYWLSKQSNGKITTNERNVKPIDLGSDEIFSSKPPFILITGTQDFKLTEKEVENLRKYVQLGGAIWGDSSVPGQRSRFDLAFRREMKRVIPDKNKQWEPLPADHPIFSEGYFTEIKSVPPGLNFYQEPVEVLRIYGEIAILYTANDYGDMLQFGLTKENKFDDSKDKNWEYVAMNARLWDLQGRYIHNISEQSVLDSYKFATNMVIHLLTRWEDKLDKAPRL